MVGDRNSDLRTWSLVGAMLALVAAAAYVISVFQPTTGLLVGLGALLILAAMANSEVALYILICSMLLGPQMVVSETAGAPLASRGLTLRLDDFFLIIIGLLWLARLAIHSDLGVFTRTPLNQPIACYTFACIFSTGVGMLFGRVEVLIGSLFTLKYIEYFLIYFLAANNLKNRDQVRNYIVVLLLVCLIAAVIGIAMTPYTGGRASAAFEGGSEGLRAGNSEPNSFGGYLTLMLGLTLGLAVTLESTRVKLALSILAAVILFTIGATLSRSSFVATVPLYLSLLFFGKRRTGLLIYGLVALVLFLSLAPQTFQDRIMYTYVQPPEAGQIVVGQVHLDTSTSARIMSWQSVLTEGWPQHPLLGWGVTGYGLVDAQYPRTLAEVGSFGFAAFLWLVISVLRFTKDHYQRASDPLLKGICLGFLAGQIAILTHAIGANSFIIVRIMEPYWFLAAIVMMIPQIEEARPSAQAPSAFVGVRR